MPHFGHILLVIASVVLLTGVAIGARTIFSSRSVNEGRVTSLCVVVDVHTSRDIDPNEPVNMSFLLAVE